jgi:3D (Asp-Asp-Asp) domain-containing protein
VLLLSLAGTFDTVYAADDPATDTTKVPKVDALDIPGSFKDLPDAKERVTSKRSSVPSSMAVAAIELTKLAIDTEKIAAEKLAGGKINTARMSVGRIAADKTGEYIDDIDVDALEGALADFDATAYCLSGRTASGIGVRPGIIAADPRVLPLGTVVHLRAGSYTGIYTVMDTGGRIKGRKVDVYVPTRKEAMQFGRRQVKIKVIGRRRTKTGRSIKAL